MAGAKDIQRRIKSVSNTKKITRAMEMVAATKMRRAVEAVLRTRNYANLSWETILNLSKVMNESGEVHPLMTSREEIKKVGIVLISSNRGLCGGFNTAILNKVQQAIKKHHYKDGQVVIEAEFVLTGKKGANIHHHHGHKIIAEFPKLDLASEVKEIVPTAQMMIQEYLNGTYDKILVAYTDFVSASKQEPRLKQILPVDLENSDAYLGAAGHGQDNEAKTTEEDIKFNSQYLFEPNPKEVLDEMIPRLIEVQLFQALLESNASEHSARMNAMHQATEAAKDMVSELTLYYNKARQAAITAEIAEISAGAGALQE